MGLARRLVVTLRELPRLLLSIALLSLVVVQPPLFPGAMAVSPPPANVIGTPTRFWGPFSTTKGELFFTINETGFAVRIEFPRDFRPSLSENDTSVIYSDIQDDYFYYSVWDESQHYWYDNTAPCSKPIFSIYDPNAPYCAEVWSVNTNRTWAQFQPLKHIWLRGLTAPKVAGVYNVTITVATGCLLRSSIPAPCVPGSAAALRPDFRNGKVKVLQVPVSMREDPGFITGTLVDDVLRFTTGDGRIRTRGVVYGFWCPAPCSNPNTAFSQPAARALVNVTTGSYNLSGLYTGWYVLRASAGFFPLSNFPYQLTQHPTPIFVSRNVPTTGVDILMNRGCIISGTIQYRSGQSLTPITSISGNPFFNNATFPFRNGRRILNYTVEAYQQATTGLGPLVARFKGNSSNTLTDSFSLNVTQGTIEPPIGSAYPPLGTEFAGFGPGTYVIRIYIYGYVMFDSLVTAVCPNFIGREGQTVSTFPTPIRMVQGAVINGTIRFFNPNTFLPETPRQGEITTLVPFGVTDEAGRAAGIGNFYGGNVLVKVFDPQQNLRGLVVYNQTFANGTAAFRDRLSIPFFLLGFSDFFNRTYSGVWRQQDGGLDSGAYTIQIFIRGYFQNSLGQIILSRGSNQSIVVEMDRGGAIRVTTESFINRFGTRAPQEHVPFLAFPGALLTRFLRIYFFSPALGCSLSPCYVEANVTSPGVTTVTATFTGRNWQLFQGESIVWQGFIPNRLDTTTYGVQAYFIAHVQAQGVSTQAAAGTLTTTRVIMLQGVGAAGTVPFIADNVFTTLNEQAFIWNEARDISGFLRGVDVVNASASNSTYSFLIIGFGGKGHFFYVGQDGARVSDYGMEANNYTVRVPNFPVPHFGIAFRFFQTTVPTVNIRQLATTAGVVFTATRMHKIVGVIRGVSTNVIPGLGDNVPLSFVAITDGGISVPTFDGDFVVHLPPGPYQITFTIPGYIPQTVAADLTVTTQLSFTILLQQSGAPCPCP